MNNIEWAKEQQAKVLSVDPSLKECEAESCSEGWYAFELNSEILRKTFPELFMLGFNKTRIDRINDKFVICQYFTIGHFMSQNPFNFPSYTITRKPAKRGKNRVKKCEITFGFKRQDITLAQKRNILTIRQIQNIAREVFMLMSGGIKEKPLDFIKVSQKLLAWEEKYRVHSGTNPEDILLGRQIKSKLLKPRWSHLLSLENIYFGSIYLTVPVIGDLEDLDIVQNFSKFYNALKTVLKKRHIEFPI